MYVEDLFIVLHQSFQNDYSGIGQKRLATLCIKSGATGRQSVHEICTGCRKSVLPIHELRYIAGWALYMEWFEVVCHSQSFISTTQIQLCSKK